MKYKKTKGAGVKLLALLLGCLVSLMAHAVNKCTGADGAVVYQDAACSNTAAKSGQVKVWTNASDPERDSSAPNPKLEGPPQAEALLGLYRRWADAERLALSTGRIALSGPAANLQALQRESELLKVPACLGAAHATLNTLIAKSVEAILFFMSKEELPGIAYQVAGKRRLIPEFESSIAKARCK